MKTSKKTMQALLTLVLLLCGYAGHTQRPHMDTVSAPVIDYYYPPMWSHRMDTLIFDPISDIPSHVKYAPSYYEIANYFYTEKPLTIIGAVASAELCIGDTHSVDDASLDNWAEYLKIYKPGPTGMVELASAPYSLLDTSRWWMPPRGSEDNASPYRWSKHAGGAAL